MPNPGDIIYSPRANRFYQVGRRGAVSRDTAVRNLTYDAETRTFLDSTGRTIDRDLLSAASRAQNRYTATDAQGRTFVSAQVQSRAITETEARLAQVNQNQDVTVRTVVTTADGKTHVFYRSFGLGRNVDPETAKTEAAKSARAALLKTKDAAGNFYEISTPSVRNSTVSQDFYRRTVQAR